MNELHLFAGGGGGILGGLLLGHACRCAVELEPFRRQTLLQRQRDGILPRFPIWDDVRTFDGNPWRGQIDAVCGGFPCQDISAANFKAVGITGARSGLWKQMLRIIGEVGPGIVFVENSPMLTGRGLGVVLGDLATVGYDAVWGVLGADDLGGFHQRERLFIMGHRVEAQRRQVGQCQTIERAGKVLVADTGQLSEAWWHGPRKAETEQACDKPAGCSNDVAHIAVERRQEGRSQVSELSGHSQAADGGGDCLWKHVEFLWCQDGKVRATKPGLCGMAHGVANRVDRISAIGDGQVPVVVAIAWTMLYSQLTQQT